MDPVHTSFLHSINFTGSFGVIPELDFRENPLGMMYVGVRRIGDNVWVRSTEMIMPNLHQLAPTFETGETPKTFSRPMQSIWAVPLDDTNTMNIGFNHYDEIDPPDMERYYLGTDFGQMPDRPYEERQRLPGDYDAQVSIGADRDPRPRASRCYRPRREPVPRPAAPGYPRRCRGAGTPCRRRSAATGRSAPSRTTPSWPRPRMNDAGTEIDQAAQDRARGDRRRDRRQIPALSARAVRLTTVPQDLLTDLSDVAAARPHGGADHRRAERFLRPGGTHRRKSRQGRRRLPGGGTRRSNGWSLRPAAPAASWSGSRRITTAPTCRPPFMPDRSRAASPRAYCVSGTWGAAFYRVSPEDGDLVIEKHRHSAFIGTALDQDIARPRHPDGGGGTGVQTHVCVESSLRDASARGYYVVVPRRLRRLVRPGSAQQDAALRRDAFRRRGRFRRAAGPLAAATPQG